MRAFVAIDFPDAIHAALADQQAAFRAACQAQSRYADEIRWTRPEGIHLTLKFLGQVPEDRLKLVTEALELLGGFERFWVEVKGFGFFPNPRRPRVFWVGLEAPAALQKLVTGLETAMEGLGFPREQRGFTPHLTLARFKSPRSQPALEALLKEREAIELGRFEVAEFYLFESKLSPAGATYRKVARFPGRPAAEQTSIGVSPSKG
jgi:2'-5' RNA ligase